ncbi:MAG: hypothetical protein HY719_07365, partial [Planctomycetes bacterium]|nr:hypothetical protein [Planctomycetota bacterium]
APNPQPLKIGLAALYPTGDRMQLYGVARQTPGVELTPGENGLHQIVFPAAILPPGTTAARLEVLGFPDAAPGSPPVVGWCDLDLANVEVLPDAAPEPAPPPPPGG